MSYDIGNLGLKGGSKKHTALYVGVAVVVIVVVVIALFLANVI
ncbi:MAG TPA: hypothetical protein VEY12_06965 [Thermoplasmata archaeon]|nr:hypothetical protein [Thermoplasmata archaeon]